MKKGINITTVAGLTGLGVVIAACSTAPVTVHETPAAHSRSASAQSSATYSSVTGAPATRTAAKPVAATPTKASPATTKTVVRYRTVGATPPAPSQETTAAAPPPAPTAAPAPVDQNVTDPWAVVSAYYGDIESGNFAQAFALIGNGATTGQSYQDFVAGFSCTGAQAVSENWDSGDQVNFNLAAGDTCNGTTTYYTGTDTVQGGIIVGADVVQAG